MNSNLTSTVYGIYESTFWIFDFRTFNLIQNMIIFNKNNKNVKFLCYVLDFHQCQENKNLFVF